MEGRKHKTKKTHRNMALSRAWEEAGEDVVGQEDGEAEVALLVRQRVERTAE